MKMLKVNIDYCLEIYDDEKLLPLQSISDNMIRNVEENTEGMPLIESTCTVLLDDGINIAGAKTEKKY